MWVSAHLCEEWLPAEAAAAVRIIGASAGCVSSVPSGMHALQQLYMLGKSDFRQPSGGRSYSCHQAKALREPDTSGCIQRDAASLAASALEGITVAFCSYRAETGCPSSSSASRKTLNFRRSAVRAFP
jgi:hypothetical protein